MTSEKVKPKVDIKTASNYFLESQATTIASILLVIETASNTLGSVQPLGPHSGSIYKYGVPLTAVSSRMRRAAESLNRGYLVTPFGDIHSNPREKLT